MECGMKRAFLLIILILFVSGKVFGQFSLEIYFNEKLETFNSKRLSAMTDMTKKVVEEKLDSIPIKVVQYLTREGNVMKQELTSITKDDKQIKKLFETLNAKIIEKFGKAEMDEGNSESRNCFWRTTDKTVMTLAKTPSMTMLTMLKMQ